MQGYKFLDHESIGFGRLDSRSNATGGYILNSGNGRFVGKAPEAPSAPGNVDSEAPTSQTIKPHTLVQLQAFDHAVKRLESIVRPDVLAPIIELRKRL